MSSRCAVIRNVCPTIFLCVEQGPERLRTLCFLVCGVHSYPLMLACQSIK